MTTWYRTYQTLLENDSSTEEKKALADRVFDFLEKHAGISPNFDPEYDDPSERWTGPDSAMLCSAAEALKNDADFTRVHSSWSSGTYHPWNDSNAEREHNELVKEVNKFAKW